MPLWFLLIPFALFLLVFLIFSIIDLANAWRFRSGFFSAAFLILAYLAGTSVILGIAYSFLSPVDWAQSVGLGISLPASIVL
jgi:hypothetical protein